MGFLTEFTVNDQRQSLLALPWLLYNELSPPFVLRQAISVGLPSWLYLKVRWARLSGIVIAVNIVIIVVAIFAAAIGSYSAILEVSE